MSLNNLIDYFKYLRVSFHEFLSLFGFFTFVTIAVQLISGIMLAFSYIPEPMMVPSVRDEEDQEDLYIDDFFWLHERGVDLIFIFIYFHFLRKLYLNILELETEASWKSGAMAFILFQVVVFLGLILCCTHLSEVTLTIAANIFMTFLGVGKVYWWLFTDKLLNTDTVLRLVYAHYLSAFFLFFLGVLHGIDMHYDWKNEVVYDGLEAEMQWWDEALSNELLHYSSSLIMVVVVCSCFFHEIECLSYEIFMWGDIGFINDIRFLGIAPHWYFRPLMAWLNVCPYAISGIIGLIYFFIIIYYQPNLHGTTSQHDYSKIPIFFWFIKIRRSNLYRAISENHEINFLYKIFYFFFLGCFFYTTSFLPFGKYYNRIGGNSGFLAAFFFVFAYLGVYLFRRPSAQTIYRYYIIYKSQLLQKTYRYAI